MAGARNIKADARRLVDELPDTAAWEDLMYEIYVRVSIEAGLLDVEAGRVVSHEDAVNRIRARLRGRRRAKTYAAYQEASRDPAFLHDMNADLEAFDATVSDGLSPTR